MNSISAISLVVANLIVAVVVITQRWGYYSVILVYWFEALIIGLYNLVRMVVVCWFGEPLGSRVGMKDGFSRFILSLVVGGFFVLKWGAFALGLGFLVASAPAFFAKANGSHELFSVMDGLEAVGAGVMGAALVLLISHGVSFVLNFLIRGEYKRSNVLILLVKPYARMILVLVVLVLGFVATYYTGDLTGATGFAVAIVLVKLAVDLVSHAFEHRKRESAY